MTENIEPTPASAISKLSDIGEIIERALVSEDELTREVGAIALELTQSLHKAAEREVARKSEDASIQRLKAENEGLRELGRAYRATLAGVVDRLRWISVKERLPEPFVSVLVQMPGEEPHPTVREGFISNDGIWCAGHFKREPDEVTHWAKMPEPPKEGE